MSDDDYEGIDPRIAARMRKTRERRDKANTDAVVRATKDEIRGSGKRRGSLFRQTVLGLLFCVAACGPAPTTPLHAATTVAVPVPAVTR